jgi:hypothetical protein
VLVPVPAEFETDHLYCPTRRDGTTAVIFVSLTIVNVVAVVPSRTIVAPVKFLPRIEIDWPWRPDVGVKPVTCGGGIVTVKFVELWPVPFPVVTEIGPVVAPAGTYAVTCESETKVVLPDVTPLNATAVRPVKFEPLIVTFVPTGPCAGENEVITGAEPVVVTEKFVELVPVPSGFVTAMGPVVAPVGTVAGMLESVSIV